MHLQGVNINIAVVGQGQNDLMDNVIDEYYYNLTNLQVIGHRIVVMNGSRSAGKTR